jgi:hypothetical protein
MVVFVLAIILILVIFGSVLDIFSAFVVVLPLLLPIAHAYGVDPYHLGVIFLLNLEVGYLHPPVGLNLFITSVKFQRPITEVMWATIPFLITMIVALLTITYVPQLTEWSTPEEERTMRVEDLAQPIHQAVSEIGVVKDVALVDAAGNPLKDGKGAAIVVHLKDCETIKDVTEADVCKQLFIDVKDCRSDKTCAHKKIAAWTVANRNGDDPAKQIVLVDAIPLINADGTPFKDKSGAQVTKKLADCASSTDEATCRELFVNVSSCMINPPDDGVDPCKRDKISRWAESNASDSQ